MTEPRTSRFMHPPLPERPTFAGLTLRFGRIVVIEWLPPGDRPTGEQLVCWMKDKRYDTRRRIDLYRPATAQDLLTTLHSIAAETSRGSPWPLIHIEAHGDTESNPVGYWHRDASGAETILTWDELEPALRAINVACECNLMLVSASCWGHAAILASCRTFRAPFVACVGFSSRVAERVLLESMKEFYRVLLAGTSPQLAEAVESAQREIGSAADIDFDLIHQLSYETFEEEFADQLTPAVIHKRALDMAMRKLNGRLPNIGELTYSEARTLLQQRQAADLQRLWDRRFMIDLYPTNRPRFDADIYGLVSAHLDRAFAEHTR